MPPPKDEFVGQVKQGVRDLIEGEPFFGVGTKILAPMGERVMREYHHYKQKLSGTDTSNRDRRTIATIQDAKRGTVSRKGLSAKRR
jgi:hypothetical protein